MPRKAPSQIYLHNIHELGTTWYLFNEAKDVLALYMIILAPVGDAAFKDIEILINGFTLLAKKRDVSQSI